MDFLGYFSGLKASVIGFALIIYTFLLRLQLEVGLPYELPAAGGAIFVSFIFYAMVDSQYKTWAEVRKMEVVYRPVTKLTIAIAIIIMLAAIVLQLMLAPSFDVVSLAVAGLFFWHWLQGHRGRYTFLALALTFLILAIVALLWPNVEEFGFVSGLLIGIELIVAGCIEHVEIKRWFAENDAENVRAQVA